MATKWGIMGCGAISSDFIKAVNTIEEGGHEFVAAATRDNESKAAAFAKDHGIPRSYGSYLELAQDKDIDVVYIGTLAKDHYEHSKLMIEHGKNVLCEKPVCVNVKQVKELIEFAKQKGVFFMEAMWARFNPLYVQLRKELESGIIGDVVHVHSTFGVDLTGRDWMFKKEYCGGSILDLGIYNVHLASLVFWRERPIKIHANACLNEEGECDVSSSATIVYAGNRTADSVTNGLVTYENNAFIAGTKGIIQIKGTFWCGQELITPKKTYTYPEPEGFKTNFPRSYFLKYEAIEVRRCLQEGLKQSPNMTWNDSILMHEILTEIRKQCGVIYYEDE